MVESELNDRVTRAVFAPDQQALSKDDKRSAWTHVAAGAATKLGEKLSSPEMILPWFMSALGAPIALVGLLIPIRQAGSLLPQILLVGWVRRFRQRKKVWAASTILQGLAVGGLATAVVVPNPVWAGWWLVLVFGLFSVVRGIASISYKDALARSTPEGTRGSILGARGSVAGALGLAAGGLLQLNFGKEADAVSFPLLLLMAGGLMGLAAAVFWTLPEKVPESEPEESEAVRDQLQAGWRLLRGRDFRRFIAVRGLFLAVPLAYPFFALEGREQLGARVGGLGLMLVMVSLAEIVSSPLWGRLANRASHHVMAWGGGVFLVAIGVWGLGRLMSGGWSQALFLLSLFLLGFSYAGVRLGRKAYLVEAVDGDDRALHVATANTCIGVLTLGGFGLALVASWTSVVGVLLTLAGTVALATGLALRLPSPKKFGGS